jgi:hypothetical protein
MQTSRDAPILIAECWLDGCFSAGAEVRKLCPAVYVHPTVVEVICTHDTLKEAILSLARHAAIDRIDFKHEVIPDNFGGRAILGSGPTSTSPAASRVLSSISVENSTIAVIDSGIDMNNCLFYDSNITSSPWIGSRVVASYQVQSCENCGRCCIPGISPPNCRNELNTCGNYKDEAAHGTHVCGTIAGQGPSPVDYANGIANGSKIFFQDVENVLNDSFCFKPSSCGFGGFSDLLTHFELARTGGACVGISSCCALHFCLLFFKHAALELKVCFFSHRLKVYTLE